MSKGAGQRERRNAIAGAPWCFNGQAATESCTATNEVEFGRCGPCYWRRNLDEVAGLGRERDYSRSKLSTGNRFHI